ncbi:hypothetical protein CIB95_02435 [Lottiidibacillus patelloidae]|uniref:DUF2197 domain-containing protein n=1 Tax=Lottiidibacillus patelloidae TaxID=2670334 RepID=A0A263BXJ4_9BACI|nr:YlaI family protein [Lottiidibacillus patelloidae]OZM58445.1 hypothetical protein CIB95_02435 [Lottiidibacillus patelloidae]
MRVKCVLCDKIESIDDNNPLAKKLRNRPIHTYMCNPCNERIAERTTKHLESGDFKLFRSPKKDEDW